MKWVLIALCFMAGWLMAASQVQIKGSKVMIQGTKTSIYMVGIPSVSVSTSTVGQCIGILCGVTHAD